MLVEKGIKRMKKRKSWYDCPGGSSAEPSTEGRDYAKVEHHKINIKKYFLAFLFIYYYLIPYFLVDGLHTPHICFGLVSP